MIRTSFFRYLETVTEKLMPEFRQLVRRNAGVLGPRGSWTLLNAAVRKKAFARIGIELRSEPSALPSVAADLSLSLPFVLELLSRIAGMRWSARNMESLVLWITPNLTFSSKPVMKS